ncbi:MAG: hypothetical protein OXU23_26030, partial [Candidatus Poribacteria bacterium]|nr:hypothetical protein [Candidatus Poribacteria bacterium]
MKAILTVAIVLGLLITSANADTPAEKPSEDVTEAQSQKNMEICKQHFREIGKAIQAYNKEHGDFPKSLSELHPKYLPDANLLLCPADKEGGKPISYWNA